MPKPLPPMSTELGERERSFVFAVAMKYVKDEQAAEDVTQDALLQAHRHRDSFRGDSLFSTWLYRVAATTALMHLRKQRRIRREKLMPMRLCEDDGLPILDPADPTPSPEERTSGEEIAELVDRRLARLGEGYRRVFWLRFRDGYTESEIAEILGLNLTTVKTRAFRARVRLRQQLSDCLLAAA